jgi:hypothetical protein
MLFKDGSQHHEPVGTRFAVAPEVILGSIITTKGDTLEL